MRIIAVVLLCQMQLGPFLHMMVIFLLGGAEGLVVDAELTAASGVLTAGAGWTS